MKKSAAAKKLVSAKKSTAAKQAARTASPRPVTSSSARKKPLVGKEPRSIQRAAVQAGVFLHIDDTWSTAYFNVDDLHCMERELFG
jgi:hypothetical protein